MSSPNKNWNQNQIEYENTFKRNQEENQNHSLWINSNLPITRHRQNNSLDSSFNSSYSNQPLNQQELQEQQQNHQNQHQQRQRLLSLIPVNRRSSSLSIDQNYQFNPTDSSSSTSINYPTDAQSSTSSTIDLDYNQFNKPHVKRSQSKLSLVTAIPASILKKDKPGLLSQEQKRANHIASEQKRRAAIRQGYNRLCLIVPSLRTPLGEGREDQEGGKTNHSDPKPRVGPRRSDNDSPLEDQTNLLCSTTNLDQDESNSSMPNANTLQGKRDKQLQLEANRPAPRSEAVVLAKTVEYLRELESERNLFLEKLEKLRMIAISKGIQISHNRHQHRDRDKLKLHPREDLDNGIHQNQEHLVEKENKLEAWEDKWYGNIHQIDLELNNFHHPQNLKGDHENLPILDLNFRSNLEDFSPRSITTNTATFIPNSSVC